MEMFPQGDLDTSSPGFHLPLSPQVEDGLDHAVAEPEGGRGELVEDAGGAGGGVLVVVAELLQLQREPPGDLRPENPGQELVVGDVLNDGDDDPASLLVDLVQSPVWVDGEELGSDVVVLSHHHGVQGRQTRLLVGPLVPGQETVARGCPAVRYVGLERQQGGLTHSAGPQEVAVSQSEVAGVLTAVQHTAVNVGGQHVHLLPGPELLLARQGPGEGEAGGGPGPAVVIVLSRHRDGETPGLSRLALLTASTAWLGRGNHHHVVVQELTPLHQHEAVLLLNVQILVEALRDQSGAGQGGAQH